MGWNDFWKDTLAHSQAQRDLRWQKTYRFDEDYSWQWELWEGQPEALNEAWIAAQAELKHSPEDALSIHLANAENGHPFSMSAMGWFYEYGEVVALDLQEAESWYGKALNAGSWLDGINRANLLNKLDRREEAQAWLEEAVQAGHLASNYWLARHLWYERKRPGVRNNIQRLLEALIEEGHPGAQLMLARMMVRGQYGLLAIPKGLRLLKDFTDKLDDELDSAAETASR